MDANRIKEKIGKLLAFGNDGRGNRNEMEAALRQAEALMRKHGISQAEIQESTGQKAIFNWEHGYYAFGRDGKPVRSNPEWFQWMAVGVARFTDTIVKQSRDADLGYGVQYYGDEDDVIFALWLIAYLKDAIRRATKEADCGSKQGRESFRKSMALGLCERMRTLRAERDQAFKASPSGTALVVVNQKIALRDAHFGGEKYKTSKASCGRDYASARKGFEAAQKVQFNRPVSGPSANTPKLGN